MQDVPARPGSRTSTLRGGTWHASHLRPSRPGHAAAHHRRAPRRDRPPQASDISRLKTALREARGEVDWLRRRNTELEALVMKDSHNSSRPPSTDPPWAGRTKSLRRPSGRRVGGRPGHAGHTLRPTMSEESRIFSGPLHCGASSHWSKGLSRTLTTRLYLLSARGE